MMYHGASHSQERHGLGRQKKIGIKNLSIRTRFECLGNGAGVD